MTTTKGERIILHCLVPTTARLNLHVLVICKKKKFDDDNGERVREGGQERERVTINSLYET
jgi:hypothetical protein